jgi:hypothetical protein
MQKTNNQKLKNQISEASSKRSKKLNHLDEVLSELVAFREGRVELIITEFESNEQVYDSNDSVFLQK